VYVFFSFLCFAENVLDFIDENAIEDAADVLAHFSDAATLLRGSARLAGGGGGGADADESDPWVRVPARDMRTSCRCFMHRPLMWLALRVCAAMTGHGLSRRGLCRCARRHVRKRAPGAAPLAAAARSRQHRRGALRHLIPGAHTRSRF
jgi:hypothetical protein